MPAVPKAGHSYVPPVDVTSPKGRWKLVRVLSDGGPNSWSAAEGRWDDEPRLAIRWNGGDGGRLGSPQSRGLPTWFVVPPEIEPDLRECLARAAHHSREGPGSLKGDLMAIGRQCAGLPTLDPRPADQILGYNETGLPE